MWGIFYGMIQLTISAANALYHMGAVFPGVVDAPPPKRSFIIIIVP